MNYEAWLRARGKDDLHECTWEEIAQMMTDINRTCPIAKHAIENERKA